MPKLLPSQSRRREWPAVRWGSSRTSARSIANQEDVLMHPAITLRWRHAVSLQDPFLQANGPPHAYLLKFTGLHIGRNLLCTLQGALVFRTQPVTVLVQQLKEFKALGRSPNIQKDQTKENTHDPSASEEGNPDHYSEPLGHGEKLLPAGPAGSVIVEPCVRTRSKHAMSSNTCSQVTARHHVVSPLQRAVPEPAVAGACMLPAGEPKPSSGPTGLSVPQPVAACSIRRN